MATLTFSPASALTVARQFTAGLSIVRATASGTQLIVGGVSYGKWLAGTLRREENLNSTYTASVKIRHTGGSKPAVLQDVALFVDGVKRFGGFVKKTSEAAILGDPFASTLTVTMVGYGSLLDRIYEAKLFTLPLGALVEIIVYGIWYEKLRPLGVTYKTYGLNPAVFIPPILFHYRSLRECFQTILQQAPGWAIWIDHDNDLHLADTNGVGTAAPFVLSRTGVDPSLWDPTKSADTLANDVDSGSFRNREYVLPSSDLVALYQEADQTGDGVTTAFFTTYAQIKPPQVLVDNVPQQVDELSAQAGGSCYYVNGGTGVFFHVAPTLGAVVKIASPSLWQVAMKAEDLDSIAAVGPYEHVTQAQNVTDVDTGNALAQARLDLYGPGGDLPESIAYGYNSAQQSAWLEPAMLQSVDWTFPDVAGDFSVRSVTTEEYGQASLWRHTVQLGKGPTDTTGVTDAQALVRSALRRTNVNDPTRATLEIAIGVNLTTLATDTPNTYRFLGSGVIASWDARMLLNPPAGAAVVVDLLKNGVSIFPTSSPFSNADIIVIPDGSTAEQSGFRFVSDNLAYVDGDILTAVIIQVGSTTPGKNLLIHLNLKPSLAVAA